MKKGVILGKGMINGLRAGLFGILAYISVRLWTDQGWIAVTAGIAVSSCFALLYTLTEKRRIENESKK